ncbi:membrane protein [Candidatus Magnetoovum chiemensis]|nr:membrane protein [Candidatus Magnetoovum chiemensis]
MTHNVGSTDRIIRIILGLAIAAVGVYYNSWLGLIALLPIATGAGSLCLLYKILGISTIKNPANKTSTT